MSLSIALFMTIKYFLVFQKIGFFFVTKKRQIFYRFWKKKNLSFFCSSTFIIIPKVYNSHFILIKIIDHLEKMNFPFEQFEVNVLQRISLFGLDFSFSNLTLYLVLAIIVILVLSYLITKSLSLISNYWQSVIEIFCLFIFLFIIDFCYFFESSQLMMLGFSKIRKPNFLLNLSSKSNVICRKYSNQNIVDSIISRKRINDLDLLTENSMRNKLIDTPSNTVINLHKLDLLLQQSIKRFGLKLSDLVSDFHLYNFLNNRPNLKLIQSQLVTAPSNHFLYQRTNTLGELTCIEACRRNFGYLNSINLTWGQNINSSSAALTGNIKPDYACSIIYNDGTSYFYHADLKQTTFFVFEKMVRRLHPNQIINTNFYWIDDKNLNDSLVFKGFTKTTLESTYFGVLHFYQRLDPQLAKIMYMNSYGAFNKFRATGLASDYNNIPINTPKFIFTSWISNLF